LLLVILLEKKSKFLKCNFTADFGQKNCVGPSGMGKSTIASLLLRFYDIDSGEILIDGKSIYEFDLENLQVI
jgi:ABC-type multidrug transport system fused ATPase/permease subunit